MGAGIQILTEQQAVDRIYETLRRERDGEAPFALVLGAGFSDGLVSTARETVVRSLPIWLTALEDKRPFHSLHRSVGGEESLAIAARFWRAFTDRNRHYGLALSLDTRGIPEDIAAAYQAAFDPRFEGGVGSPRDARTFQRALMRLEQPRLNAPHFLLASVLGVQPARTRPSVLFSTPAALTRLILTTNFDPFLQIALQSVNRLYYMSDTPDLGLGDEIFEDSTDAIHLVYLHGSIHRRSQKATDGDIRTIKERNARILAPVLKRRGVIVLGYSGWDDVIVEALAACEAFDHRLYWCGRSPDPTAKGAFGDRVPDVLTRPSACYVHIEGAGQFMARLTRTLVIGLPRLLDNPVAQLREMLETIDLTELGAVTPGAASSVDLEDLGEVETAGSALCKAHDFAIERLRQAESLFTGSSSRDSTANGDIHPRAGVARAEPVAGDALELLLASAEAAIELGNYEEALRLYDEALGAEGRDPGTRGHLFFKRGLVRYRGGNVEGALSDWETVATLPGAHDEHVARALVSRGVVKGRQGDPSGAAGEFSRVIDTVRDAPVEQVASALINRGVAFGEMGRVVDEIADYTRVIETLTGVDVAQVAKALNHRGITWGQQGDGGKAVADFTRVIDTLPGAPVVEVAKALNNRGLTWARRGYAAKGLADFTQVVDALSNAPVDQVARALNNRGVTRGQAGDALQAVADFTRVIEGLPGAPVEQVAKALNNRCSALKKLGRLEESIADCTKLIEAAPGTPAAQVVTALVNRAWLAYETRNFTRFLEDTKSALARDPENDVALFNVGLALLANGRDADAAAAYERAAKTYPAQIQRLGLDDLEAASRTWLPPGRAAPIIARLRSA